MKFQHIPVDGSSKMPDDLMESIEPFDFSEAVDFRLHIYQDSLLTDMMLLQMTVLREPIQKLRTVQKQNLKRLQKDMTLL